MTSGLDPRDYGINLANTNPAAAGAAVVRGHGFFGGGTRRWAIRSSRSSAASTTCGSWPTTHLDQGPPLAEVRRRRPPRGDEHPVHQPAERRPDLQRRASPATPPPTSCWGLRRAGPRHDARRRSRTATAGCLPATCRTSSASTSHLTREPRPALRAADAIHRRQRRHHRRSAPARSRRSIRPRRPGSSIRATRACRAASCRPTRTTSRLASSVAWDPFGDGKTSVRSAFGVFYDALAGQGDFFQSGVLSPPFTPLVELNAPPPTHADPVADPLPVGRRAAEPVPARRSRSSAGATSSSRRTPTTSTSACSGRSARSSAPRWRTWDRAATSCRSSSRSTRASTPRARPTQGARLMPAFSLVRPTFSAAQSWYDSLQTSLRMLPTRGVNFLASYTLGKATDHVSGLNIGGESRPVLPVAQGDEASIERALEYEKGPALFDARHRFVLSFGYELPRLEDKAAAVRADRRRLAAERHLPGADRLPAQHQSRRRARHPLPDLAARRHLRPERRPEDDRAVLRHQLLQHAHPGGDRRAPGQCRRATRSAALASSARTCRSSRTSTSPPASGSRCAIESVQHVEPGALRPAGRHAGRRELRRRSRPPKTGASCSWRSSTASRGSRVLGSRAGSGQVEVAGREVPRDRAGYR